MSFLFTLSNNNFYEFAHFRRHYVNEMILNRSIELDGSDRSIIGIKVTVKCKSPVEMVESKRSFYIIEV